MVGVNLSCNRPAKLSSLGAQKLGITTPAVLGHS